MSEKFYNILYGGRKIYMNLSMEECTEVLQELSEKYYEGEIESELIEMEEV